MSENKICLLINISEDNSPVSHTGKLTSNSILREK